MNEYYDRYGRPIKYGDAVAALKGDENSGYSAALYTVGYPEGYHTLMLIQYYPWTYIYQFIPTDKDELERKRLTCLGPARGIDRKIFEQWLYEIRQLADVDDEKIQKLKFVINPRRL